MKQQLCDVDFEFGHFHCSRTLGRLVFSSFLNDNYCEVTLGYPEQEKDKHSLFYHVIKGISDIDWLRAIVDSITESTMVKATAIAEMVAAAGIPWPGWMAEPDAPNMAVGKIMARLFDGLDETLEEGSAWRGSVIKIDAKRRVRRCKEQCCNNKQEWYTKIWYCIDDEDKPWPF